MPGAGYQDGPPPWMQQLADDAKSELIQGLVTERIEKEQLTAGEMIANIAQLAAKARALGDQRRAAMERVAARMQELGYDFGLDDHGFTVGIREWRLLRSLATYPNNPILPMTPFEAAVLGYPVRLNDAALRQLIENVVMWTPESPRPTIDDIRRSLEPRPTLEP